MGLFSDGGKRDSAALRETIESETKGLKELPADAAAALRLADALVASGRRTEAVRVLNRFGPIVQSKGRLEQAIAIFKKAAQLDPDSELTSSTYLSHLQLQKILDLEKELAAERAARSAPPASARSAGPPPSGSFTRPGPDPVAPASGSLPTPAMASGLPAAPSPEEPEPVAPGPSAWTLKKEAVHGAQSGIPLLRDIPPLLLDLVLQKINLISLAPGEVLIREGVEGSSVYFVVQGTLAVTARHDLGTEVLLRTARDGEVIGEAAFLTGLPSYATVTAREQSNLLELDRNALVPIARKHRPLAEALNQLYEERVLLSALARSRVFGVLSEPELRQLTRKLETVAVPAGTLVVQEGLPAKGAWVVKRGAFRVTFRADGREVAVALLRPHEVFGDLAEGRDLPQAESVTAVSEAELLFLAAEELAGFRARSSRLAEALDALRLERAKMCVAALRAGRR